MMTLFVVQQAYISFFHYSLFSLALIFNIRRAEKGRGRMQERERKMEYDQLAEISEKK
jgi:hypothetical protein